jgi:hypothetical protein
MIITRHRANTIADLLSIPAELGVEIDLRSLNSEIVIQHNPFMGGEKFTEWLTRFQHKLLILNVKEDGLEDSIIKILDSFSIKSYFFLDQSFPSFYKLSRARPEICSTRVSEYESIEVAILLNPGWVWFDSHTGNWDYLRESFEAIRDTSIKACLVSPELQRPNSDKEIFGLQSMISELSINFDAVCTKFPDRWR